jgi:hypothetical protein
MSDGSTRTIQLTPMIRDDRQVVELNDSGHISYMGLHSTTTNGNLMVQLREIPDELRGQLEVQGAFKPKWLTMAEGSSVLSGARPWRSLKSGFNEIASAGLRRSALSRKVWPELPDVMTGRAMSPMVRKRFVTRLFQGSLEPQGELAAAGVKAALIAHRRRSAPHHLYDKLVTSFEQLELYLLRLLIDQHGLIVAVPIQRAHRMDELGERIAGGVQRTEASFAIRPGDSDPKPSRQGRRPQHPAEVSQ